MNTTAMKMLLTILATTAVCIAAAAPTLEAQTDAVPPFKLEYFVGTWAFDWPVPETPLGPSGDRVGTETFQLIAPAALTQPAAGLPAFPADVLPTSTTGSVLESRIEGTGPAGPFKARAVLFYDPTTTQATRIEIDGAGQVTTQKGTIKGDLGGIYSFTWETAVQRQGRTLYLKGRRTAFSPNNFRDFVQYSVDGKGFVTFGQPWYRKQTGR